jgi:hypothetical protein
MEFYLEKRADQGFTCIQVCALPEDDGIRKPNVLGQLPFLLSDNGYDPVKPDERNSGNNYWTNIEDIIIKAEKWHMVMALLPTWGDKFNKEAHGIGPEIFNPDNAYSYGKWLANRYKAHPNILWVLGGDRALKNEKHYRIIDRMAEGIREADPDHLITFHPCGAASSIQYVSNKDYISFHAIQSGHGLECYNSAGMLRETMEEENKPCLDMECCYEDFPTCFQPDYGYCWDEHDVRQTIYRNMMEGVCGHTYGHRSVWCFQDEKIKGYTYTWQEALNRPAAGQMQYVRKLCMSRSYYDFKNAPELVKKTYSGMATVSAGRGNAYAFLYSPLGLPIYAQLDSLNCNALRATWYNPRNGTEQVFAIIRPDNHVFVPPSSGKGFDWMLILDVMQ